MDAFENLAADILADQGYWVRTGVKIGLTRSDKMAIERPSSPRWEIDLVAYHAGRNELLLLECKSYLDSGGVHFADLLPGAKLKGRYKLFHDEKLRATVTARLLSDFVENGRCSADVTVEFGLIYGYATAHNERLMQAHFETKQWRLYGPTWLDQGLNALAKGGYENSTAAVVAKLLIPGRRTSRSPVELAGHD